jgi:hypothetical protein
MFRVGKWVTRYSPRGIPYQFLEKSVPRIPDDFLECVVYLYPSEAAAEDGEQMGGSGFIIGVPIPYTQPAPFHLLCVVTNKHVINGGSMVVRVNTLSDSKATVALDHAEWFFHPDGDDIAICPIGMNYKHKFKYLHPNCFLKQELIDMFDIGPGDDVFVVGRFINREGKQKNTPTVRFGNIAQMPGDPIILDDATEQESFLVEARSISGFSGSPVFVQIIPEAPEFPPFPESIKHLEPKPSTKRPKMDWKAGPFLMGIDFCHLYNKDSKDALIYSKTTGKPISEDWYVRSNTGMMGVIPTWRMMDVIDSPKMKALRGAFEDEVKKFTDTKISQASLDSAASADKSVPPASDANPNHLEDFKRLVDVAARKRPQGDQT